MSPKPNVVLHAEIKTDLKAIAGTFGGDDSKLQEFEALLQGEIKRIQADPRGCRVPCIYEPLASAAFRKVKFFSSRQLQRTPGEKPDLRIIFRYDEDKNMVEINTIALRRRGSPEDAYAIAITRAVK